jgi:hypothetical protein
MRLHIHEVLCIHLLLLHQLAVRAIINHILPKNRCSQRCINLLGINILQLPIQDKLVALRPQTHGRLLPQQNEREDISVLLSTREEEGERVDAVGDRAADDGEPVEYNRRLIRVFEQQLAQNIQNDGEGDEGGKPQEHDLPDGQVFDKSLDGR